MLAFSVGTDRAVYPSGTDVVLTLTVRNRSGSPCLFVDKPPPVGDSPDYPPAAMCQPSVDIQDYALYPPPDGVAVYAAYSIPCPPGPPTHWLTPGTSYSFTSTLNGTLMTQNGSGATFNQGPGKYLVNVVWWLTAGCAICPPLRPQTPGYSAQATFLVIAAPPTTTTSAPQPGSTTTTSAVTTSTTTTTTAK